MSAALEDPSRCALAFDVGSRWLGVAIGNPLSHSARPLVLIDRQREDEAARIQALISEWRPSVLVVGDPLGLDGAIQESTLQARAFARRLRAAHALPVTLVDERSSSREADRRHAAGRRAGGARRKHAAEQDAAAASIILERWLDAGMPIIPPP